MFETPILVSSERYKQMREIGYIDEHGQFTEKFQDDFYEQFKKMMDRAREEREAEENGMG